MGGSPPNYNGRGGLLGALTSMLFFGASSAGSFFLVGEECGRKRAPRPITMDRAGRTAMRR